uniref:Polysaccharide pyruvyl transferase domain-containing protein n=1 Tax=Neobacillus citreus TaxID=2833578 RepID=A0A942Y7G6_9BACI
MSTPVRAFWWSPRRDPRVLAQELRDHAPAWARLSWARGRPLTNHGDELSALVLREAIGRSVRWAPLGSEDVVAIGSAVGPYLARGGVGRVWGTGLHDPSVGAAADDGFRQRVLAIRGPLARAALGLDASTQLGDPGLVTRALRPRVPGAARRGVVLITHFLSYTTSEQRAAIAATRAEGVRVLPPTLRPTEMLDEIGRAEHVLSAGMHGVILSHALRTPATLVTLRNTVAPAAFKYHDYYASVGLQARPTAWTSLVSARGRRRALELAEVDARAADDVIDSLVDGLLRAARPLRST